MLDCGYEFLILKYFDQTLQFLLQFHVVCQVLAVVRLPFDVEVDLVDHELEFVDLNVGRSDLVFFFLLLSYELGESYGFCEHSLALRSHWMLGVKVHDEENVGINDGGSLDRVPDSYDRSDRFVTPAPLPVKRITTVPIAMRSTVIPRAMMQRRMRMFMAVCFKIMRLK